jgi:enoyl-CoA hydratase/carnithine racemase
MRTRPTTLVLDQLDQVLWIRLNRPEARNAIDPVMRDELLRVFEEMGSDRTIRCAVITARGPDFCIGEPLVAGDAAARVEGGRRARHGDVGIPCSPLCWRRRSPW